MAGQFGTHRAYSVQEPVHFTMPIDRLPPEILAECFLWYIRIYYHLPKTGAFNPRPSSYAWLIIRHVCRRWRQVALTSPELSSYIWLTSPECVYDLLNRSRNVQLHVCESQSTPSISYADFEARETAYILVLNHFERVVCGQLQLSIDVLNPFPSSDSTATLPQKRVSIARELRLFFCLLSLTRTPQAFAHYDFPYLEDFFCGSGCIQMIGQMLGPSLRRLEFWDSLRLSTLDDVVALLARLTQLEELKLQYALGKSGMIVTPTPPGSTQLPHLRVLDVLEYDCGSAAALLSRLIYPATTSVSLEFLRMSNGTFHEWMTETFLSHLRESDDISCTFPPLRSISISARALRSVEFKLWTDSRPSGKAE